MGGQSHSLSLAHIAQIARALGDLSADVVFIGGAIAPLLQTHPVIPGIRPTKDVDALVASTSYGSFQAVRDKLVARGFKIDSSNPSHAHRFISPDRIPFDLVPTGDHLGTSGSEWDRLAIETSVSAEIEPGLWIRHASAPAFLALKWAAFNDRGTTDPFQSHDLEDILALVVSRPLIVKECSEAPEPIRNQIRVGFQWLAKDPGYDDLVAGHLANAQSFQEMAAQLRVTIHMLMKTG